MSRICVFVEGKDETYILPAILRQSRFEGRSEFKFDAESGAGKTGVDAALEKFRLQLRLRSTDFTAFGLIIDANENPAATWERVRQPVIREFQGDPGPLDQNLDGMILRPPTGPIFGAFLLPGNGLAGSIERLLWDAAEAEHQVRLKEHSQSFVDTAEPKLFLQTEEPTNSRDKAYLAAWLSIQHDPGIRSANAIDAEIVSAGSLAIQPLLNWLSRLRNSADRNQEGIQN